MKNTDMIVIYDSFTNNTSSIAGNIAEVLGCEAVSASEFKKLPPKKYELIVMGSPVISGKPTKKIIDILDNIESPKKCAVFCTFGAPVWGQISSQMTLHYMKKRLAAPCLGRFACPGLHVKFGTYKNRPDNNDMKKARTFAAKIKR